MIEFQFKTLYNIDDEILVPFRNRSNWELAKLWGEKDPRARTYGVDNWDSLDLFAVEMVCNNDEIVGISGSSWFGDYLQVGIEARFLNRYWWAFHELNRSHFPFLSRHFETAKEWDADGLFICQPYYGENFEKYVMKYRNDTIRDINRGALDNEGRLHDGTRHAGNQIRLDDRYEKRHLEKNGVKHNIYYHGINKTFDEFSEDFIND